MELRPATYEDIPAILELFDCGRRLMRATGNMEQWPVGYPARENTEADIAKNSCFLFTENGEPVGVFSLLFGPEPNYRRIDNGAWHYDLPYGTLHRIAGNGRCKGLLKACLDYCRTVTDYVRIDTHADNAPMLGSIRKNGFRECGTVYMSDGTPRTAFDLKFTD